MNTILIKNNNFIKVERYSFSGFTPKYQSYHIYSYKKQLAYNPDDYTGLQKQYLLQYQHILNFQTQHLDDLSYGIWVFFAGHKNNQSLNHLKCRVPRHYAWLPENILVYDINWQKSGLLKDMFCPFGVYVPKKSLEHIIVEGKEDK